jgi:hypothetical protein
MRETSGGPQNGRAFGRATGGRYRALSEITESKSDIHSLFLDWVSNLALQDDSLRVKSRLSQPPDRTGQTQLYQGHAEKWVVYVNWTAQCWRKTK